MLPIATTGCSPSGPVCYDPELLSTPEIALRTSQGFMDVSPHNGKDGAEVKRCIGCQFFRAEGEEDCGHCQILNGPVSANGHCNAWSALKAG
jgi:hypothetical protein